MAKDVWWLREKGQVKGPFRLDDLRGMKASGQLTRFHRLSRDQKTWLSPSECELGSAATASRTELPPPSSFESPLASVSPPPIAEAAPAALTDQIVIPFPLGVLMFLHYSTFGLFTVFWVLGLHGKLPRTTADELSVGKAHTYALVPFVNLMWGNFIVYPELCRRINHVRAALNLSGQIPAWFATIISGMITGAVTLCLVWVVVTLLTSPGVATNVQAQNQQAGAVDFAGNPVMARGQEEVEPERGQADAVKVLNNRDDLPNLVRPEPRNFDPMALAQRDPMATNIFLLPAIGLAVLLHLLLIPVFALLVQANCNQIGYSQIRLLQGRRPI